MNQLIHQVGTNQPLLFLGNLHIHFPKRAQFLKEVFLNPKTPNSLGLQTTSHLIRWSFSFAPAAD